MRVTVLRGGPGDEREVSLRSGAAVADGLRRVGHAVFETDISPADLSGLETPCDVVFPVLHGEFGEDGQLQSILKDRGLKFVGSDSKSSRIAIDKLATKRRWLARGIPTPAFHIATRADSSLGEVDVPCVVKPLRSGSSVGVRVCMTADEAMTSVAAIIAMDGEALVEQFIRGTEITVGMLDATPLPPIRIVYENGFFDYQNKYGTNGAKHSFDTGLDAALVKEIQSTVAAAHAEIGCRDLSRTDVMIDEGGAFYLLEINTMPGFTSRSLLPEAAERAGVAFDELVDRLVEMAAARSMA